MSGVKNVSLLQKREMIKAEYLNGEITNKDLADKYDVSVNTINDWIKFGRYGDGPWVDEKRAIRLAQKRELIENASAHLPTAMKTGAEIIEYGLIKVKEGLLAGRYEGRETQIVKDVVDVLGKVHKILRLEDNKSTQNTAINVDLLNNKNDVKEVMRSLKDIVGEDYEVAEVEET